MTSLDLFITGTFGHIAYFDREGFLLIQYDEIDCMDRNYLRFSIWTLIVGLMKTHKALELVFREESND